MNSLSSKVFACSSLIESGIYGIANPTGRTQAVWKSKMRNEVLFAAKWFMVRKPRNRGLKHGGNIALAPAHSAPATSSPAVGLPPRWPSWLRNRKKATTAAALSTDDSPSPTQPQPSHFAPSFCRSQYGVPRRRWPFPTAAIPSGTPHSAFAVQPHHPPLVGFPPRTDSHHPKSPHRKTSRVTLSITTTTTTTTNIPRCLLRRAHRRPPPWHGRTRPRRRRHPPRPQNPPPSSKPDLFLTMLPSEIHSAILESPQLSLNDLVSLRNTCRTLRRDLPIGIMERKLRVQNFAGWDVVFEMYGHRYPGTTYGNRRLCGKCVVPKIRGLLIEGAVVRDYLTRRGVEGAKRLSEEDVVWPEDRGMCFPCLSSVLVSAEGVEVPSGGEIYKLAGIGTKERFRMLDGTERKVCERCKRDIHENAVPCPHCTDFSEWCRGKNVSQGAEKV